MDKFKRILIVENDDNDRELTLDVLKELKLLNNIDIVKDGAEAIDYLLRRGEFINRDKVNPILVLMDINVPKFSGKELLKFMKQSEIYKTIPVVVFTSSREELDIIQSYHLGANAYCVKPIVPSRV